VECFTTRTNAVQNLRFFCREWAYFADAFRGKKDALGLSDNVRATLADILESPSDEWIVCSEHPSTNPQLWHIPNEEQEELMTELRDNPNVRDIGVKIKTTNSGSMEAEYMWVYFNNGAAPPAESNGHRDEERRRPRSRYKFSEEEREYFLKIKAEESTEVRAQKFQDYEDKLRDEFSEKMIRSTNMRVLLDVNVEVLGGGGEDSISEEAAIAISATAIAKELRGVKVEPSPSTNTVQSDKCSVAEMKESCVERVLGNGTVSEKVPLTKHFLEAVLLETTSVETRTAEKKKAMLEFMLNYMWRALAPTRHVSQWSLRIGVSCVVTKTPDSLTDLLSAVGISTSVNHSVKTMEELVTLGSTEMLDDLIRICEGKVVLVHADNFCVITKLKDTKLGDGVVNTWPTITRAVKIMLGENPPAIISDKRISPGFSLTKDLLLAALKERENAKATATTTATSFTAFQTTIKCSTPPPSAREFFMLPQEIGIFGQFKTYFEKVIGGFSKFNKALLQISCQDYEGQRSLEKALEHLDRHDAEENVARKRRLKNIANDMGFGDDERIACLKQTIPLIGSFHLEKASKEAILYNQRNMQLFFAEFLEFYGEPKFGKEVTGVKGMNTKELKEEAKRLGVQVQGTKKEDFIAALMAFKLNQVEEDGPVDIVLLRNDMKKLLEIEEVTTEDRSVAASLLEKAYNANGLSEADEADLERVQEIACNTSGERDKSCFISYSRSQHIMNLLWLAFDGYPTEWEGKGVLKGEYRQGARQAVLKEFGLEEATSGEMLSQNSPKVAATWQLLEKETRLGCEPFDNLQDGDPGKFLNALFDLGEQLAYYGKPKIAQMVALVSSRLLYLQKEQTDVFKEICSRAKDYFADVVVELLNSMVSRMFKGSPIAMSEEKIRFYGMLANFKAEIMKMGEKKHKRELQCRREKRYHQRNEESVKKIFDYILKVFRDAKSGASDVGSVVPLKENRGKNDFLERIEELPTSLEFKTGKTIPMMREELKAIDELLGTCSLALLDGQPGRKRKIDYETKVAEMQGKEADFKKLNDNQQTALLERNREETETLTKRRKAVDKEKRVQKTYRKETNKGKRELEGMTNGRYKRTMGEKRSKRG